MNTNVIYIYKLMMGYERNDLPMYRAADPMLSRLDGPMYRTQNLRATTHIIYQYNSPYRPK